MVRYDAIVIGGGLGGMLAALAMLRAGRRVLLVERLPHLGGRFSTVDHAGCQISTGALHLVPHGGDGPLASLLRRLDVPLDPVRTDVVASFHHAGRNIVCRRFLDVLKVPARRGSIDLLRIFLCLSRQPDVAGAVSFRDWLNSRTTDATVRLIFERAADFALSLPLDQISYREMRAVVRNIWRLPAPAAPSGGCRGLTSRLAQAIRACGGEIALGTQASEIAVNQAGRVTGVWVASGRGAATVLHAASLIVSDIGPAATRTLLKHDGIGERLAAPRVNGTANGLKLQLLSDVSLVPHRGIMFCLDTRRISGIVQVSNAVPEVAPPGKHLLNTFQALGSGDIETEKQLALADLTATFGSETARTLRVIHAGAFRGPWPVNRALQGRDERNQHPCPGLVMVGDAYKPSGFMMVEGVAASVCNVLPSLLGTGDHLH